VEKRFVKILSFGSVIISMLFILLTYVYFNLIFDADILRKKISSKIEQNIPNVFVNIEGVSLKARSALRLRLSNILVRDSVNGKPVFSTRSVTVRLPFSSFFFGVGNMELFLERPQVFHNNINNDGRLHTMLKNIEKNKKELPSFFNKTIISLKAQDTLVEYKLSKNKSGITNVKKILIKNIGLNADSAFELNTSLETKDLTGDVILVGGFNLGKIVKSGSLDFKSAISLKNIHDKQSGINIPSLSLNMNSILTSKGSLTGKVDGKHEKSKFDFSYKWEKGTFELNFNDTSIWLEDFVSYKRNVYGGEIKLSGSIGDKADRKLMITGNRVRMRFEGRQFVSTGTSVFQKNKFAVTFKSDFDDHKFIISRINGKVTKENNYIIKNSFIFDGIFINEGDVKLLKSMFNKNIEKKYFIENKVTFRNMGLLGEQFSGTTLVDIDNGKWGARDMLLKLGRGNVFGDLNYNEKTSKTIINAHLQSIELSNLSKLFLTENERLSGLATGKVKGYVQTDNEKKYKLNVSLSIKDGIYYNNRFGSLVTGIENNLRSLDIYKKPLYKTLNGKFSKLEVESVLGNKIHYYKKIDLIIGKKKVVLSGKGSVYLNKSTDSEIYISLTDNVGLSQITDNVTFLLTGKGYRLTPNYKYTMSKLIKKPTKKSNK
jgi:hypothetical protein